MRALITVRPRFPIPPEQFPALVQGFRTWRERYRTKMESFYFFAGTGGGGGVINAASEAELSQIMLEWPFAFFSEIQVDPVFDGDEGIRQLEQAAQMMQAGEG